MTKVIAFETEKGGPVSLFRTINEEKLEELFRENYPKAKMIILEENKIPESPMENWILAEKGIEIREGSYDPIDWDYLMVAIQVELKPIEKMGLGVWMPLIGMAIDQRDGRWIQGLATAIELDHELDQTVKHACWVIFEMAGLEVAPF